MSGFPVVELAVYPSECDAFGHLNQAAMLGLYERARWDGLARGPGMDLFRRAGVWPAVRRTVVEYHASAYPADVLRIETAVVHRGTTSFTLRHTATRVGDGTRISDAEIVFVCIGLTGRAVPIPEEVARFLGPRVARGATVVRVDVGGVSLAVETRGEGKPVLFVHGFPLDRSLWRHQLAAMARWQRIAPDLRGMGESDAPAGEYSMARYAEDLVAVLDAVGVHDAVCCGLSMGGYVLFELLRRHPERVRALILCDTRAEPDSTEAQRMRDEQAALVDREGVGALVERLLPKLIGATTRAAEPELVKEVRQMAGATPAVGVVGALRAMRDRPDSTALLSAIRVPTLVIAGEEDELTPAAGMRAMAEQIPGARFAAVAAAGHLTPLEQPLVVGRLISDFLEDLP